MKRVIPVSLFVVLGVTAMLLLVIPASASGGERFRTFPTCSAFDSNADPDHSCSQGDLLGAVFIPKRKGNVHYQLCLRRPRGDRECYRKTAEDEDERSVIGFSAPTIGRYRFTWKVRGDVIDRDRLRLARRA